MNRFASCVLHSYIVQQINRPGLIVDLIARPKYQMESKMLQVIYLLGNIHHFLKGTANR
jgi:hypothetical protein